MSLPIQITVGGGGTYDPVAGSSTVSIPILAGREYYVERHGYGTLPFDVYTKESAGGFTLEDSVFSNGELYTIHFTGVAYGTSAGSYSNGFAINNVLAAMFGRLGWRQPTVAGAPVVASINQLSKSGRYFNDFHALCTVPNLRATTQDPLISDADFNNWLESLQRSTIMRALNGVFSGPEYIEQVTLINRDGRNDQAVANTGKFVGIRIEPAPTHDVAVQIDSIALYFDGDATVPLKLYRDNNPNPLWEQDVEVLANTQTVVNIDSLVLSYLGGANKGGIFYLGYDQTALGSVQAIDEQCTYNRGRCFGWQYFETANSTSLSEYGLVSTTFGLNADISTFKDHTNAIVKKAALFDELIGLQMAAQAVETILYSTRSNKDERILKEGMGAQMAFMDLNGAAPITDSPTTVGLVKRIAREEQRVRDSFRPKSELTTQTVC